MIDSETIVRIAGRGDGVTGDGRHIARAVPGDRVAEGAVVERGPHHVDPPCRHFDRCGGCRLQHADDTALEQFVRDRVVGAAAGQGVTPREVLDVHLSPPRSRRRATLHAERGRGGTAVLGFREAGSHRIVDMEECWVLDPALFDLVAPLRNFLARHGGSAPIDLSMVRSDQGIDLAMTNLDVAGLQSIEAATGFAAEHRLARLSIDQGYGAEPVWEPEPATVTLSGVPVPLPIGAFLQATPDAERRMIADVSVWLSDASVIADLFAGLGTFAFGLAQSGATPRRLLAVEADRAAHLACRAAAPRAPGVVKALHRDLFRNPVRASEFARFDAAILDPPRAGARTQIAEIAASKLARVVYVSCNPASWARDAATLAKAGFTLSVVRPIGQFRWSTHVELTSLFERT